MELKQQVCFKTSRYYEPHGKGHINHCGHAWTGKIKARGVLQTRLVNMSPDLKLMLFIMYMDEWAKLKQEVCFKHVLLT